MRPRAGWLQGHPQAVPAGVDGELPVIRKNSLRTARATIRSCWRRWRRSSRRLMTLLRNMAASASRLCLAPAPPACMKATRTLTCAPTGSRAPRGTMHNKSSAIRRVFSATGWRSTAQLYPFNRLLLQCQSDDQRAQAYRGGAGRCRHCGWCGHPEPNAD